jgi:hypothetical protein
MPGYDETDRVVNKKAEVVRVYLPPDPNCLLPVTDHCLRSPAAPAAPPIFPVRCVTYVPGLYQAPN